MSHATTSYPVLPQEFFSIAELVAMLGPQRRDGLIGLLKAANVSFVVGRHGWPLVYRDRLLPGTEASEQDSTTPSFNFDAIHAASRTSAHRRQ
ncbi:MAG: hypothetical protein JWN23_637 [Rhodocyclales bacterium]|nr:hypothetical protein [Rhodocyclales bacterium]